MARLATPVNVIEAKRKIRPVTNADLMTHLISRILAAFFADAFRPSDHFPSKCFVFFGVVEFLTKDLIPCEKLCSANIVIEPSRFQPANLSNDKVSLIGLKFGKDNSHRSASDRKGHVEHIYRGGVRCITTSEISC